VHLDGLVENRGRTWAKPYGGFIYGEPAHGQAEHAYAWQDAVAARKLEAGQRRGDEDERGGNEQSRRHKNATAHPARP
jgi:hypothetical protein